MGGRFAALARLALSIAGADFIAWALGADAHWAERHVLPSYCATGGGGWVVVHGARLLAAAFGVALIVLAPALSRRAAGLRGQPRRGSGGAVALAIAASLGVTELYLRHLHHRLTSGAPAGGAGAAMTRADPRLGWSYLPGRTTWVDLGGRRIAYAVDAEGNRAPSADAPLPDRTWPTVLFAGESIAFGYGLPWEETAPALVGRDLGLSTVNLAVIGYGSDQAYLRVADALPRYDRPLAVVTIFIPDQLKRNVDAWRPRLALAAGGALAPAPPAGGPRILKLLQELPWHGDEPLRVTAAILRATAEAARARGAFPLFVVTNYGAPCLHGEGEESWVVEELFVRQRLPFVRVDLGPEDRLPGITEHHPNARGARRIADAVERALPGASHHS
jgi:lysophospholipase L1-like esterase